MNFLAYLQLIELSIPLAIRATAAVQAVLPDSPGNAKFQMVLASVQSGLLILGGLTATVEQLAPIINSAVALHKVTGTSGFAQTVKPA